jgi:hypothetical protein
MLIYDSVLLELDFQAAHLRGVFRTLSQLTLSKTRICNLPWLFRVLSSIAFKFKKYQFISVQKRFRVPWQQIQFSPSSKCKRAEISR